MGSRTCIVKMSSFDMSPVVKGCDGNVRVTTEVIGYLVPGANRDSPSRLPSSPLFVSPASQLSPPMSNSWYDTLTSTPALIATALGVSVAALFFSTHAPNNSNNNNSKTAAQVKEQVKEVAQSVHAEGSKGKMAQAVRHCVAARLHGYTGNGQRATGLMKYVGCIDHVCSCGKSRSSQGRCTMDSATQQKLMHRS